MFYLMRDVTEKSAGIDAGAVNVDRSSLSVQTSFVRGGQNSAALVVQNNLTNYQCGNTKNIKKDENYAPPQFSICYNGIVFEVGSKDPLP